MTTVYLALSRRYRSVLCTVFLFAFALGCTNGNQKKADPEIEILNVSGKSATEVEKVLGKGNAKGTWKDTKSGCSQCPRFEYKSGEVEIIYIDQKADRITINDLSAYNFDPETVLNTLSLPHAEPNFKNDSVLRWQNHAGLREISAFALDGRIDYILILAQTE
jgi:hypothetical protein